MIINNNLLCKIKKISPICSIIIKNPLFLSKFLIKSLYHQINNVICDSSQISYLTDSEKLFHWERFVENMIDVNSHKYPQKHNLKNPLIVSLTSFPKRFKILHYTIKSLLAQTITPDKIILWISYNDKQYLTQNVLNLQNEKFIIKFCNDFGSYKKIIPTLIEYKNYNIITADDDLYYSPTWIEELLSEWTGDMHDIVAHRIHKIKLSSDGQPEKYNQWRLDDISANSPSVLNFPTSGAGVLYPRGTFHEEILNIKVFQEVCNNCDDIWLYWMARLNGSIARRVCVTSKMLVWPDSQEVSLFSENMNYKNDLCVKKLIARYGLPFKVA